MSGITCKRQRVPLALMGDALEDIGSRCVRLGLSPQQARTQVLDELSTPWAEHAGRNNARRAHDALMMMDDHDLLTREQRRAYEDGQRVMDAPHLAAAARHCAERDAIERRCMGMSEAERSSRAVRDIAVVAGIMALIFAIAIGGLFIVAQGAQAAERGARFKDLATCGVTAMDDPRYEARCRQFSRSETAVIRPYDPAGAGAPREWEAPRSWE